VKKSTKILIVVLVLLGIVYVIQRLTFTTSTTENSKPFSRLDTSKVNQISIKGTPDGRELVIRRESRGWFIVNPIRFPASRSQVNLLLAAIAENPSASVVADNLSDSLAYGLDANAPSLNVSENIQKGISLRVGNVTPDFDGCYVEIDRNGKILDLTKNIRTYVAQSLTEWRDKRIFDFTIDEVQTADFSLGDTLYHFIHVDTSWQVNGKEIPAIKADNVIGDFIGTMAMGFIDTSLSMEKSPMDYGFSISNGTREADLCNRINDSRQPRKRIKRDSPRLHRQRSNKEIKNRTPILRTTSLFTDFAFIHYSASSDQLRSFSSESSVFYSSAKNYFAKNRS
jgi:Domain of unknown function (DUF4340)